MQYTQDADEKFPCGNANNGSAASNTYEGWASAIYPFVKSTGVYKCPDETAANKVSYGINYAIFHGTPSLGFAENLNGMSLAQLASPASTVQIFEGNGDASDPSLPNTLSGYFGGNKADIAKFHDKDATQSENYLACDGHVKYVKIPYISLYDAQPNYAVPTNNMGSSVLTFSYL